jgi:hypothetical protein
MYCSVYDFDDTLFITNSKIHILNKNKEIVQSYTSSEYRDFYDEIKRDLEKGYDIDYSEFHKEEINEFTEIEFMIKDLIKKYLDGCEIFILTARGIKPEYLQNFIFNTTNIKIPLRNIFSVSYEPVFIEIHKNMIRHDVYKKIRFSRNTSLKKVYGLINILLKGYKIIDLYDDDQRNITEMNKNMQNIKEFFPNTIINLHHI